jgi:opacity protein-like surface antigen
MIKLLSKKFVLTAIALIWSANIALLFADGTSQGSVYGKIYTDWYYDVSKNDAITQKSQIELQRVYLGYKYNIDERFLTDACMDVQRVDPATGGTATFDTTKKKVGLSFKLDDRYFAYLKVAYLSWKNIFPTGTLSLGQIPYFAFDVQEPFWGYRYIYPTFMDKNGLASSADLGASLRMSPADFIKIVAGVTNGEGYKASQDKYGDYKIGGGVQLNPVKPLTLYVYGDWMPIGQTSDTAQSTIATFAGYKFNNLFRIGFEYDGQFAKGGVADHDINGFSVYGAISPIKVLDIFARFDLASSKDDWNTSQDGQTVIAGVQYSPVSKVKLAIDYQRFTPKPNGAIASDRIYLNGEFDY